ncbi:MAG: asparagine synthase (glutamine-hydrolyzing) [Verrucomicrobiae bacterium]|nr:asparagine synthase (glutamine-hydrolyzing) [Verrucomicrobiae bacterium]
MCGILAYLGLPPPESALTPPSHRGPDGHGRKDFATPAGSLRLEHWRLSILDLSDAAAQPMSYGDGRFWIVFNGEIYNYLEIRAELEMRGYRFVSRSDTEVLLAAWTCWGEGCLERLNGMFAFALYDAHAQRLFAARDRFGVKPLYVVNAPEGFGLASEIKQLAGLPFVSKKIHPQNAFDYLAYGMQDHGSHGSGTLWRDVVHLPMGSRVTLDLRSWKPGEELPIRRWYQLTPKPWSGTAADASEQYGALLRDSVRLRLRSDVPVGSCLSGGMDSSSIVALVHELRGGGAPPQMAFSSCMEDARFDERRFIHAVVEKSRVRGVEVFPSVEGLFRELDDLVWHQDEPFASASIYAQSCVFRAARAEGVKVMLDGQGGDEQLASYPIFAAPFVLDAVFGGRFRLAHQRGQAFQRVHGQRFGAVLRQVADLYFPLRVEAMIRPLLRRSSVPPWMKASAWGALGAGAGKPWRLSLRAPGHEDWVQQLSRMQIERNNLPMLLHWEDRNSMRFGVEARLPFMDFRLVEFALSLPSSLKMAGDFTKAPLREAMRGRVPDLVLQRRDKMGFATSEEVWLRQTATGVYREKLRGAARQLAEVLDGEELSRHFEETVSGARPFNQTTWRVICFGAWARRFGMRF